MMAHHPELREMETELLGLLDEEIRLLHLRGRQFDELYEAILHRDDDRLETLLDEMTDTQRTQGEVDTRLQAIRAVFSRALGCRTAEMKLSMLIGRFGDEASARLQYKREQIIILAEQLKKKPLNTAILLGESARINRMLLEGLLPGSEAVTTYGAGGTKPWRTSRGLVDAEM